MDTCLHVTDAHLCVGQVRTTTRYLARRLRLQMARPSLSTSWTSPATMSFSRFLSHSRSPVRDRSMRPCVCHDCAAVHMLGSRSRPGWVYIALSRSAHTPSLEQLTRTLDGVLVLATLVVRAAVLFAGWRPRLPVGPALFVRMTRFNVQCKVRSPCRARLPWS